MAGWAGTSVHMESSLGAHQIGGGVMWSIHDKIAFLFPFCGEPGALVAGIEITCCHWGWIFAVTA
jgi:hypothetical protein